MIPSEWLDIAEVIQKRWDNRVLAPATIEQWGADLADLPASHVRAAVDVLARAGREFAPGPGAIREEVVRLRLDSPDWAEVLAHLRTVAAIPVAELVGEEWREDGSVQLLKRHPRAEHMRREHPLVAAFVDAVGWEQVASGLEASGNDEARLREKWQAFVRRAEREGSLDGMEPVAGLPALERPRDGDPRRLGSALDGAVAEIAAASAEVVPVLPAGPEAPKRLDAYACPAECGWEARDVEIEVVLRHLRSECPRRRGAAA